MFRKIKREVVQWPQPDVITEKVDKVEPYLHDDGQLYQNVLTEDVDLAKIAEEIPHPDTYKLANLLAAGIPLKEVPCNLLTSDTLSSLDRSNYEKFRNMLPELQKLFEDRQVEPTVEPTVETTVEPTVELKK